MLPCAMCGRRYRACAVIDRGTLRSLTGVPTAVPTAVRQYPRQYPRQYVRQYGRCYLLEWWLTLFVKALGIDLAGRVRQLAIGQSLPTQWLAPRVCSRDQQCRAPVAYTAVPIVKCATANSALLAQCSIPLSMRC